MSNKTEILSSLSSALSRALSVPLELVTEFSSMDNLKQWDSLRFLLVIHEVEKTFNLRLENRDWKSLRSVKGLLAAIEEGKGDAR